MDIGSSFQRKINNKPHSSDNRTNETSHLRKPKGHACNSKPVSSTPLLQRQKEHVTTLKLSIEKAHNSLEKAAELITHDKTEAAVTHLSQALQNIRLLAQGCTNLDPLIRLTLKTFPVIQPKESAMQLKTLQALLTSLLISSTALASTVQNGCDILFSDEILLQKELGGQKVGIITNHTGRLHDGSWTLDRLEASQKQGNYKLTSIFALEHGVKGHAEASEAIEDEAEKQIPVFSLYGQTDASLRPTKAMLDSVDTVLFDIQDVGSRFYTYNSSLFYFLESVGTYNKEHEHQVRVIVLDRPNPIGGTQIDGPRIEKDWHSFIGVMPIPVCHGMTSGELATLFNGEYNATPAPLKVLKMRDWGRSKTFRQTQQLWMPPSPNIPTAPTCSYYPMTVFGEGLTFVNVGKNSQLPFRVVLAPWIDGVKFSQAVNKRLSELHLEGVRTSDYNATPLAGAHQGKACSGILLTVTDADKLEPVAIQYAILETLQNLYPKIVVSEMKALYDVRNDESKRLHRGRPLTDYHQACWLMGTDAILEKLRAGTFNAEQAIAAYQKELSEFKDLRSQYLLYRD